jgi:hypothetical protein
MTVGIVWERERDGILVVVVVFLRIERGEVAVVTVMGAKGVWNGDTLESAHRLLVEEVVVLLARGKPDRRLALCVLEWTGCSDLFRMEERAWRSIYVSGWAQ